MISKITAGLGRVKAFGGRVGNATFGPSGSLRRRAAGAGTVAKKSWSIGSFLGREGGKKVLGGAAALGAGALGVGGGSSSYNAVIIMSFILHFVKVYGGTIGFFQWALDLLAFFFFLMAIPSRDKAEIWKPMLVVFAIEALMPLLSGYFFEYLPFLQDFQFFVFLLSYNLLTPWWFIFFVMKSSGDTGLEVWSKRLLFVYFILMFFGMLFGSVGLFPKLQYFDNNQAQISEQLAFLGEMVENTVKNFGMILKNAGQGFMAVFRGQMDIATDGAYYSGRVDKNAQEILGVFIEEFKPSSDFFYRDEKASVFGKVKAKTIDLPIDIELGCYTNGAKESIKSVYPKKITEVYDLDEEQVDCIYNEYSEELEKGHNDVTLKASFDFETMAYQKNYFMDKDRINALKRKGIDPLAEYEITDKNPVAVFTNGPVMLGMELSQSLVPISTTGENVKPRLGVTIDTNYGWEGKIKEIKDVILEVPDSMSFELSQCNLEIEEVKEEPFDWCVKDNVEKKTRVYKTCVENHGFKYSENNIDFDELEVKASEEEEEKMTDECFDDASEGGCKSCIEDHCKKETEGYKIYRLVKNGIASKLKEPKNYITISCRLNIDDPEKLLGNTPVAIKNFRARVFYSFEIEKETTFEIRGTPGVDPGDDYYQTVFSSNVFERQGEILKQYQSIIDDAKAAGVDPCFSGAMINHLSEGIINEKSDKAQLGLMQIYEGDALDIVSSYKDEDDEVTSENKYSMCGFSDVVKKKVKDSNVEYYDPEVNIGLGNCKLRDVKENFADYTFSDSAASLDLNAEIGPIDENKDTSTLDKGSIGGAFGTELNKYSMVIYLSQGSNRNIVLNKCCPDKQCISFEDCMSNDDVKGFSESYSKKIDSIIKTSNSCDANGLAGTFDLLDEKNKDAKDFIEGEETYFDVDFVDFNIIPQEHFIAGSLESKTGILLGLESFSEVDDKKTATFKITTNRKYDEKGIVSDGSYGRIYDEKTIMCTIPVDYKETEEYFTCKEFPFLKLNVKSESQGAITKTEYEESVSNTIETINHKKLVVKFKMLNNYVKNTDELFKGKKGCKDGANDDNIFTQMIKDDLYIYYSESEKISFHNKHDYDFKESFCTEDWDVGTIMMTCENIPQLTVKSVAAKDGKDYYDARCEDNEIGEVGFVKVQIAFDPTNGSIEYSPDYERQKDDVEKAADAAAKLAKLEDPIVVDPKDPSNLYRNVITREDLSVEGTPTKSIDYLLEQYGMISKGYEIDTVKAMILDESSFNSVKTESFCLIPSEENFADSNSYTNYHAKVCLLYRTCLNENTLANAVDCSI